METKLGKYCFFTPFKIFLIGVVLSFLFGWIFITISDAISPIPRDPHCMMGDAVIWLMIFYVWYNIFGSISLFTIALNLFKTIRDNKTLRFLTFFVYPILAFPFLLSTSYFNIIYTIVLQVPLLIPTIYYYIRFKKRQASGELLEDYYYNYDGEQQND